MNIDSWQLALFAGIIAAVQALVEAVKALSRRRSNGHGISLADHNHAWQLRTQECKMHQSVQSEQTRELISAIDGQTAELRHILMRGFQIEDTHPGRVPPLPRSRR